MEEFTLIQIALPKDLDIAISNHLTNLKFTGVKTSKAELVIKLIRIGWLKESIELRKEERAEK